MARRARTGSSRSPVVNPTLSMRTHFVDSWSRLARPVPEMTCRTSERGRTGSLPGRSEEHTSELQSLMRLSYAVCCLKKKKPKPHPLTRITYRAHDYTTRTHAQR